MRQPRKRTRPGPRKLKPLHPETRDWGEEWRKRHLSPAEQRAPELDLMWRVMVEPDPPDDEAKEA